MKITPLLIALAIALILRFYGVGFLGEEHANWVRISTSFLILGLGAFYVLRKTADVIEETTHILSQRTKLAGGLLQSFGTAFPDMVLGLVAAVTSLKLRSTDPGLAVNYAIIAASTTFGSNIYNIGHMIWCSYRQNLADQTNKIIKMFPFLPNSSEVTPLRSHKTQPSEEELSTGIKVATSLSILTGLVAISMVLFGRVDNPPAGFNTDIYQLTQPVGIFLLFACLFVMYYFRKAKRSENSSTEVMEAEQYLEKQSSFKIWAYLAVSAAIILLAAESMVHAIQTFCEITNTPFVIAGVLAGIIGCLGEMIVIHNYFVNPKGRIGDAVVGVAMDNIVTTMGASIVAIMGGIFLGGSALIVIFVIILVLNTILIYQTDQLKKSCT